MAFRHQIELTNEENIGSLILKCGTFSTTCPVTYPEGNTDESTIPSSAGTGVDVECTIRIIISDPYQDPELATYSYAIEFYASGGSPDLSGISIGAPAYQPLKINEEESEFTLIRKPEHLYGYTDPNATGTPLYAWTTTGVIGVSEAITFYTLTDNPTAHVHIYTIEGVDVTSTYITEDAYITNASQNSIIIEHADVGINWPISSYDGTGSAEYLRDSSKDTIIYNTPQTLYSDSTTLTTGMTLYDNTGTDTGLMIGTVNQDDTFDIGGSRTISWIMECTSQNALNEDCIRIIVNGIEYGSKLYTENSLVFNIGDTVSWSYNADGGNVPVVTESSNTSFIALGYGADENTLTFTMPNENLTFTLYTQWSGPV